MSRIHTHTHTHARTHTPTPTPTPTHTGAAGAATCLECAAGKFSSEAGANSSATCRDCDAGTFSPATGATSASACSPLDTCAGARAKWNGLYSTPCPMESYTRSDGTNDTHHTAASCGSSTECKDYISSFDDNALQSIQTGFQACANVAGYEYYAEPHVVSSVSYATIKQISDGCGFPAGTVTASASGSDVCGDSKPACESGDFCNFDDGAAGVCETCPGFLADCTGQGVSDRGRDDCYDRCFAHCSDSTSCPSDEDSYCNFEHFRCDKCPLNSDDCMDLTNAESRADCNTNCP